MNILTAWGNSLALFKPKNLKLFMLVTLKTMVDGLKTWLKYFWWVPAFVIVFPRLADINITLLNLRELPLDVFPFLTFVSMLLAIRPSTAKKNCAYFRSYVIRALLIIPMYLILLVFNYFFAQHTSVLFTPGLTDKRIIVILALVALCTVFIQSYLATYTLFVFDGDGSLKHTLKSILHAGKMLVYNYPSYVLFSLMVGVLRLLKSQLFFYPVVVLFRAFEQDPATYTLLRSILAVPEYAVNLILLIFWYSLLTNLYVKKLHDQYTLYFGKND